MSNTTFHTIPASKVLFSARLYPYRSLSKEGFRRLMIFVAGICFLLSLGFYIAGAWPVVGFFGLDVLIIYLAFRSNYRSARIEERIQISRDELRLQRHSENKKPLSFQFKSLWVLLKLEPAGFDRTRLIAGLHGKRLEFGKFLSEPERRGLYSAMQSILVRIKAGH